MAKIKALLNQHDRDEDCTPDAEGICTGCGLPCTLADSQEETR